MPVGQTSAGGKACWRGISQAVKEFGRIAPHELVVIPETTHAIYIKP